MCVCTRILHVTLLYCVCVYVYICVCVYTHAYIYIYRYIPGSSAGFIFCLLLFGLFFLPEPGKYAFSLNFRLLVTLPFLTKSIIITFLTCYTCNFHLVEHWLRHFRHFLLFSPRPKVSDDQALLIKLMRLPLKGSLAAKFLNSWGFWIANSAPKKLKFHPKISSMVSVRLIYARDTG